MWWYFSISVYRVCRMDIAFVWQRDCLLWLTAKITKIKSGHSKVNFWNKETDLPIWDSEGLLQERFKRLLRSYISVMPKSGCTAFIASFGINDITTIVGSWWLSVSDILRQEDKNFTDVFYCLRDFPNNRNAPIRDL